MQQYELFDRNTKRPAILPPAKSCDNQIHVFGPLDRYPLRPGAVYYTPEADLAAALTMHKTLGIERGVIVQSAAYGVDYRILVDALVEAGKSYRGVAVVDDTTSDADFQAMHDAGVRGIRFNFFAKLKLVPSLDTFRRSVSRAEEMGWFVKIHGTGDDLLNIAPHLRSLKVNSVIDHMAHPELGGSHEDPSLEFIRELLRRDNWWFMISGGNRLSKLGYPWQDVVDFARGFVDLAPDRMIWATDWPHPLVPIGAEMVNDCDLLEHLYRCAPTKELQRKILVSNPARLLGFED